MKRPLIKNFWIAICTASKKLGNFTADTKISKTPRHVTAGKNYNASLPTMEMESLVHFHPGSHKTSGVLHVIYYLSEANFKVYFPRILTYAQYTVRCMYRYYSITKVWGQRKYEFIYLIFIYHVEDLCMYDNAWTTVQQVKDEVWSIERIGERG